MPSPLLTPILRFAPSPNGRLHLGHAFSALLNQRMAEVLGGKLLLRIEDIDPIRSRPELIDAIHEDLAWLGLSFDGPVRRQSEHLASYAKALKGLAARSLAYPCFCSRKDIADRVAARGDGPRDPDGAPLYPGTCRDLLPAEAERRRAAGEPHTWRLDMARALVAEPGPYSFHCFAELPAQTLPPLRRRVPAEQTAEGKALSREVTPLSRPSLTRRPPSPAEGRGPCAADGPETISADPSRWGDAVIARRDVPTSYHLSVVLDDSEQGITHVVRGRDLEAATDLHVLLQQLLGLETPAYHHHHLIRAEDGQKLAKSKGSQSLADLRAGGLGASEVRAILGFR